MADETPQTYRWRRRRVLPIRVTWIGMVAVFMLLAHLTHMQLRPMGMTAQAGWFIVTVLVPVVLVALWRAGLLPPERVPDGDR